MFLRPLPSHPQFLVAERPGHKEYRIENWHIARDGSGRKISRIQLTWTDSFLPLLSALGYLQLESKRLRAIFIICVVLLCLWLHYGVMSESVILIPPHGLQLETRHALFSLHISTSRRFIPHVMLRDVVINEGLSGWNVRYYLAIIKQQPSGSFSVDVAFQNILPHLPVLKEVYKGVHAVLFKPESLHQ